MPVACLARLKKISDQYPMASNNGKQTAVNSNLCPSRHPGVDHKPDVLALDSGLRQSDGFRYALCPMIHAPFHWRAQHVTGSTGKRNPDYGSLVFDFS